MLGEMEGPGIITHIWITVDNQTSEGDCFVLRDLVLRMYWDEEKDPSVEVPLGDFFCCGFGKECLVNSSAVTVVPSRGLNTYFQMPFRKKARITLENQHANPIPAFFYQIDYCLYEELPENAAYFHASFRRQALTEIGKDYVIIDGIQGPGHYAGTYIALSTSRDTGGARGKSSSTSTKIRSIPRSAVRGWKITSAAPGVLLPGRGEDGGAYLQHALPGISLLLPP